VEAADLINVIADARSVRITGVGAFDPRKREKAATAALVTDPTVLDVLRDVLVIAPESLAEEISLMTPGDLDMHFFGGHELLASVTFVANNHLRWRGWPFDARLREPERLGRWLREQGWSGQGALFSPRPSAGYDR
jgi:hypothetical protein